MAFRGVAASAAAVALALGLAACSSSEDELAQAEADYCQQVEELSTTVAEAQSFDNDSTIQEIRQWREDVSDEFADVKAAAQEVSDANSDAMQDAFDELSEAIDDLSNASTLGDVREALSSAASNLSSELDQALAAYNCSATD